MTDQLDLLAAGPNCRVCGDTGRVLVERACGCQAEVTDDAPGLFTGAAHGAPETQRIAAFAIQTGKGRWRVLQAIMFRPASDEELVARLGMLLNTVRPRRNELMNRGLIEDSGTRRETRTGRTPAVVWQVSRLGQEWWDAHPDGGVVEP